MVPSNRRIVGLLARVLKSTAEVFARRCCRAAEVWAAVVCPGPQRFRVWGGTHLCRGRPHLFWGVMDESGRLVLRQSAMGRITDTVVFRGGEAVDGRVDSRRLAPPWTEFYPQSVPA